MKDLTIFRKSLGRLAAAVALSVPVHGWAAGDAARTAVVPAAPKVVYGVDDRLDVYADPRTDHRVWAASTCALISTARMVENQDGSWRVMPLAYTRFGLPACPDEPFGDQRTAPFCTGFLVGSDLIATAGHCVNSVSGLDSVRFVFGYEMLDAATLRTDFPPEYVYRGTAIVSTGSSALDHTILRLDRPVTAPGARPFRIRREGVIGLGERVGIIGHPAGLPLKIAFGDLTTVRKNSDTGFFVANTDSYAGNSGSPVINQSTGLIEGILVRGETDFLNMGTCFISNTVASNGGRGEDCTKSTVFAPSVPVLPSSSAVLTLSADSYKCSDLMRITVTDTDLAGLGLAAVDIATTRGDHEVTALSESATTQGTFTGTLPVAAGAPVSGNGTVDAAHGDLITVTYVDAANGSGHTVNVDASALIDCIPPVITAVTVLSTTSTGAVVQVDTDEAATVSVACGTVCGVPQTSPTAGPGTSQQITLAGLSSETLYRFTVTAADIAGNQSVDDNAGACFTFTTERVGGFYTEWFYTARPVDLSYRSLTFAPQSDPLKYRMCVDTIAHLPADPAGGQTLALDDDAFAQVDLTGGRQVRLFGQAYGRVYVGSNGYITFTAGDTQSRPTAGTHFSMPRVSALFADLVPQQRGTVTFRQLDDRLAVTYSDVPAYVSGGVYTPQNSHTFQAELFFDGTIRLSWLGLYENAVIVGLSPGAGVPADYQSDDFSTLPSCAILDPDGGTPHSADTNRDLVISMSELLRMVQFFNSDGFCCDAAGEDGYRPGPGPHTCTPHDSDYAPLDWRINLSELLRVVQMFNAGGYVFDPHSEDGFRPKSDAE